MTDVRRIVDPKKVVTAGDAKENIGVAKKTMEEEPEPQILIEERNSEGEIIKKYLRGKFLGKVCMFDVPTHHLKDPVMIFTYYC